MTQTTQRLDDLIFLTCDCVNAQVLRFNLEGALIRLGSSAVVQSVIVEMLPQSDVRRGYPTPTLLCRGQDLFGMPRPTPPYDTPR
jgi:hypothetical protein